MGFERLSKRCETHGFGCVEGRNHASDNGVYVRTRLFDVIVPVLPTRSSAGNLTFNLTGKANQSLVRCLIQNPSP